MQTNNNTTRRPNTPIQQASRENSPTIQRQISTNSQALIASSSNEDNQKINNREREKARTDKGLRIIKAFLEQSKNIPNEYSSEYNTLKSLYSQSDFESIDELIQLSESDDIIVGSQEHLELINDKIAIFGTKLTPDLFQLLLSKPEDHTYLPIFLDIHAKMGTHISKLLMDASLIPVNLEKINQYINNPKYILLLSMLKHFKDMYYDWTHLRNNSLNCEEVTEQELHEVIKPNIRQADIVLQAFEFNEENPLAQEMSKLLTDKIGELINFKAIISIETNLYYMLRENYSQERALELQKHSENVTQKRILFILDLCLKYKDFQKKQDFINSTGEFAATDEHRATGLMEIISDIDNNTTYVSDINNAKAKKAAEEEYKELQKREKEAAQAEIELLEMLNIEDDKAKGSTQKQPSKTSKKNKGKAKSAQKPTSKATNLKPAPKTQTGEKLVPKTVTATQEPLSTDTVNSVSYSSVLEDTKKLKDDIREREYEQSIDQSEFTHIPFSQSYKILSKFLISRQMASTIQIPEEMTPVNCEQLKNVDFFPTKPHEEEVSSANQWISIDHMRERHPETLNFLKTSSSKTIEDTIRNTLKQVVETVKPEDIEESREFTNEKGKKIPVNVIKFTSNITFNGEMKKVTCVFSKPHQEILNDYRLLPNNENKHALVMRTMYIDGM